jgi:hypothetical protein
LHTGSVPNAFFDIAAITPLDDSSRDMTASINAFLKWFLVERASCF